MSKITTPEFRVSFPNVFKAKASFEGQDPTFNIQMLFPKTTDMSALKKLAAETAEEKFGADWKNKNLRSPFRDGDEKNLDNYKDMTFVNAKSKMRPGIVDVKMNEIIDASDFYAGCWARATVTCFAYDFKGNKGVAFGLQNIQKLRDDEAFSGRSNAKDDFQPVEVTTETEDYEF